MEQLVDALAHGNNQRVKCWNFKVLTRIITPAWHAYLSVLSASVNDDSLFQTLKVITYLHFKDWYDIGAISSGWHFDGVFSTSIMRGICQSWLALSKSQKVSIFRHLSIAICTREDWQKKSALTAYVYLHLLLKLLEASRHVCCSPVWVWVCVHLCLMCSELLFCPTFSESEARSQMWFKPQVWTSRSALAKRKWIMSSCNVLFAVRNRQSTPWIVRKAEESTVQKIREPVVWHLNWEETFR